MRRSLSDSLQNILRGRIHRLSAAYHVIRTQIPEQRFDTCACRYRNESEILLGLHGNLAVLLDCLVRLDDIVVLLAHILDLYREERAELQPLHNCLAGVVGVYMHLDYVIVIYNDNAVADGFQECTQRGRVLCALLLVDDELRAVAVVYFLLGSACRSHRRRSRRLGFALGAYHAAPGNNLQHTLKNNQKSLTAGVHNASLLERREQVRGLGKALFALGDEFTQEFCGVAAVLSHILGVLPRFSYDSEDSTLGGLHDGFIRSVHADLECVGKLLCVSLGLPCKSLGKPTENQRQNNAGITSRTAQHCGCGELCGIAGGNGVGRLF